MAIALWPQEWACLIRSFESISPDISLILVWAWSSILFIFASSFLRIVFDSMEFTFVAAKISSLLVYWSFSFFPFTLTHIPALISILFSIFVNILTEIESLWLVIPNFTILHLFFISICSTLKTSPSNVQSSPG